MTATENSFTHPILLQSKKIFYQKLLDYGDAWRILQIPSLTDQILIKAKLLKNLYKEKNYSQNIKLEMAGIINYCIMAIIKIEEQDGQQSQNTKNKTIDTKEKYQKIISATQHLLQKKNHYYANAWQEMRITSIIDIILMKLYRIKKIEDNKGYSSMSENPKAGYQDIINYVFFLDKKMRS